MAAIGNGQPVLAQQPITQAVPAQGTAYFAALASGAGPLQYQWYFNGHNVLAGRTNSVLILAGLDLANQGTYYAVITGIGAEAAATSAVASLTVEQPPQITGQPAPNLFLAAGTNLILTVAATGTAPLNYQWQFDGTNLADGFEVAGSASNTLTIQNISPANAGEYEVVVTNALGAVTSAVSTVTYFEPPILTGNLANQTVTNGATVSWTVNVSGGGGLTYQWMLNGAALAGQTNASLVLSNVTYAQAGIYEVIAQDPYGLQTNATAYLSMIVAWGDDSSGQTDIPDGLDTANSVAAGDGHSLVADELGLVTGWGADDYGQIDIPPGLSGVLQVAAGGNHSLALTLDGSVMAWGDDGFGQSSDVPDGLTNAVLVAAGFNHSLAVTADGRVVAWGDDQFGQVDVPSALTDVVAVAGGVDHSLALSANGKVTAWGRDNYGQTAVPPAVANATAIAAGYYHSLALLQNGTVVAWGLNQDGQTNVPAGLTNVVAVAAGARHSEAVRNDGTVVSWGNPTYAGPMFAATLTNVLRLASGGFHNLAVIGGGRPPSQPTVLSNVVELPGDNLTWKVPAYGTPPPANQWYFNSQAMPGQTNNSLALTNIQAGQVGTYVFLSTNYYGAASNSASLSLAAIDPEPTNLTVIQGARAQFSVGVSNVSSLSYQWVHDGSVRGTGRTYSLFDAQDADAGAYYAIVTHHPGVLTSAVANLTVLVPPEATGFPNTPFNIQQGTTFTLSLDFTGSSNGLSSAWLLNGLPLSGSNSVTKIATDKAPVPPSTMGTYRAQLVVTNAQDYNAGDFTCILSNAAGMQIPVTLDSQ